MIYPEKIQKMELYQPVTETAAVRLDANESYIPMDESLWDGITREIRKIPLHRYPDPAAAEVCRLFGAYCGVSQDCIVAGNGSDELISVIITALLPQGAKLLVCDPDFAMYRFYAALCECVPVPCDRSLRTANSGLPVVAKLLELAQSADALILSNPCNPTGQGLPRDVMLHIIRSVPCLCIIDEAYMDFWDQSVRDEIHRSDRLIVLKTCSKSIGLAGIRLGFALANPKLAGVLRAVKSPYNVNAVTQAIGAVVLSQPEILQNNVSQILESKKYLYKRLFSWAQTRKGITLTDTKVNFVLLTLPDPDGVHQALLARGVAVRKLPGQLRISAGSREETDALMAALEQIIIQEGKP